MLVLTRGPKDKIVFPNLGVEVEILRVNGGKVKVGVDAPKDVRVLRHELADHGSHGGNHGDKDGLLSAHKAAYGTESHQFRNRLNAAHIALGLAEKQINTGLHEKALKTMHRAMAEFERLDTVLKPAPKPSKTPTHLKRQLKALIVEDDQNESELLSGYLRMSGFEVDVAGDGLQAMVHLAKHDRPDVVLMDMHMPRMDGVSAVKSIREDPSFDGICVFAVTGSAPEDTAVSLGPDGVDEWFRKPIQPQRLVNKIKEKLEADGLKSA